MVPSLPDGAVHVAPRCGVYFVLDDDGEVIYIGASKHVHSRAITSCNERGGVEVYCVLHDGDAASLAALEQHYLDTYKPRLNLNPKSGYHGVRGAQKRSVPEGYLINQLGQ